LALPGIDGGARADPAPAAEAEVGALYVAAGVAVTVAGAEGRVAPGRTTADGRFVARPY
jgi:hypothetical protein